MIRFTSRKPTSLNQLHKIQFKTFNVLHGCGKSYFSSLETNNFVITLRFELYYTRKQIEFHRWKAYRVFQMNIEKLTQQMRKVCLIRINCMLFFTEVKRQASKLFSLVFTKKHWKSFLCENFAQFLQLKYAILPCNSSRRIAL